MGNVCKEIGYAIFLLLSILTYLIEIALNCTLAYYLYQSQEIVWFALLLCLITVPSISIQLVSYHQQLTRSSKKTCGWEAAVVAVHILQVALPWRYVRLMLSHRIPLTSREIWESFLLRALHTFFSGLPIIFLQGYKILTSLDGFSANQNWFLIASVSTSIISTAWSLATYHKFKDYCCVIGLVPPWTATLIKIVWRVCEIFSRVLTLGLFALVHTFWVFLVIGFHWITMLLVLIVDQVLQSNEEESKVKLIGQLFLKSYMYIFTHLNLTSKKSKYGFVFFYIICCLESIALLTLWIIYEKRTQYHIPLGVAVAGGYAFALIFALLYYNCFHRGSTKDNHHHHNVPQQACLHQCAGCRLNQFPKPEPNTGSKPWLQVSANPEPQFFDILQSSDCSNSDRSSELIDSSSMQRNHLLKLDARVLQEANALHNNGKVISKGAYNGAMEWDNYDLQIRETPEGASLQDSQIKESPRSSTNSKDHHSRQASTDDKDIIEITDSPNRTLDQGYFSGISASSKENKRKSSMSNHGGGHSKQLLPHKLSKDLKSPQTTSLSDPEVGSKTKYQKHHNHHNHHHNSPHHHHSHIRQHSGSGVLSDTTTNSTFSTTSSKRPILNCERCGHCVPLDTMSLYSMTSTSATSMGSSVYVNRRANGGSFDNSAVLKRQQKLKGAITKKCSHHHHHAELQMPINVAQRSLYGYSNPPRIMSDGTSSGWEYTDSDI